MTRLRWITDWRNGAVLVGTVLVAILGFIVLDGSRSRDRAVSAAREATANQSRSAQAASRRIDLLTGQIGALQSELDQVLAATTAAERQTAVAVAESKRQTPTAATTRPAVAPTSSTTTTTAPKAATTTTASTAPPPSTCVTAVGASICVQRASRSKTSAVNTLINAPCGGWLPLVSQYPWPVSTACRILWCESRGDPNARNGRYHGLMQVGGGSFDPATNVAQAYAMWQRRGWSPWSCA